MRKELYCDCDRMKSRPDLDLDYKMNTKRHRILKSMFEFKFALHLCRLLNHISWLRDSIAF